MVRRGAQISSLVGVAGVLTPYPVGHVLTWEQGKFPFVALKVPAGQAEHFRSALNVAETVCSCPARQMVAFWQAAYKKYEKKNIRKEKEFELGDAQ